MEISAYILHFTDLLRNFQACLYALLFLCIFVESAAFTGILIPGELFVIVSGFLAFQGTVEYELVFGTIAFAAILGDSACYCIGKIAGTDYFRHHKRMILLKEKDVIKTRELINEQGDISILLARFIVGLRATTPFAAGAAGMPYLRFLLYNAAGAITWTAIFIIVGYILGFSWMLINIWAGNPGLFIFFITAIVVCFIYIFWTAIKRPEDSVLVSRHVVIIPPSFVTKFNKNHPLSAAFVRNRLAVHSYLGLNLTIRIAICLVLLWILAEITADIIFKDPLVEFDHLIMSQVVNFRTAARTKMMIIFSQMGSSITQTSGVICVSVFLAYKRKFDYLITYLTAMIGGSITVFVLKAIIHRIRPVTPASGTSLISAIDWSFPSGHSMMSLLFYGVLTYFLVRNVRSRRFRKLIAAAGAIIIFMIGLSRIYLQMHFLSDVIAGYVGGLFWLIACITALEIYREKKYKSDAETNNTP